MIVALCPSYRRPYLTCNAAGCFRSQVTSEPTGMIILEDGGALHPADLGDIKVITAPERFPDLGSKYNRLAELAIEYFYADYFAVWEDDDIYLPDHMEASLRAMREEKREWAMPSCVYSLLGPLSVTNVGIYHASIVMSRRAWEKVHWDTSGQAQFDRILMQRLREEFGPPADPVRVAGHPTYVFRFQSTGSYHGQALMRSLDDINWYKLVEILTVPMEPVPLVPICDAETLDVLRILNYIPRRYTVSISNRTVDSTTAAC